MPVANRLWCGWSPVFLFSAETGTGKNSSNTRPFARVRASEGMFGGGGDVRRRVPSVREHALGGGGGALGGNLGVNLGGGNLGGGNLFGSNLFGSNLTGRITSVDTMPSVEKTTAAYDKPDNTIRAQSSYGTGVTVEVASWHVASGRFQAGVSSHRSANDDVKEDGSAADLPGSAKGDCTVTADFREGKSETYRMPNNVKLLNPDHTPAEVQLDEHEDGAMALTLTDGAFFKIQLPKPIVRGLDGVGGGRGGHGASGGGFGGGGAVKDDGLVRTYSIMLCLRLEALPKLPMALFCGQMPPRPGEALENVAVYKNGGVGALGSMGTQAAAVRAQRWAWITITRKDDTLCTYVNAMPCAQVSPSA